MLQKNTMDRSRDHGISAKRQDYCYQQQESPGNRRKIAFGIKGLDGILDELQPLFFYIVRCHPGGTFPDVAGLFKIFQKEGIEKVPAFFPVRLPMIVRPD